MKNNKEKSKKIQLIFLNISRKINLRLMHVLIILVRLNFSARTYKLLCSETVRTLPKRQRIIYFYTTPHLHFKKVNIYEISDNPSSASTSV